MLYHDLRSERCADIINSAILGALLELMTAPRLFLCCERHGVTSLNNADRSGRQRQNAPPGAGGGEGV